MKKFTVVFIVLLGLATAAVLVWGVTKATQDLAVVISAGIGNLSQQAE